MAARSRLTIRVLGADGEWRSHTWTAEVDSDDPTAVRAEVLREVSRYLAERPNGGVNVSAACARPEEVH